ncbi:MAG: hypothetical protein D3919_10495, partial [Candidatus Electrothrix sp. AW5]|nr:hypothetical protein [Candidatus Electrothrix gigas]
MKKLPIGISTLSQIIEGGYVYIDKTREALELIENYKYVFLARPRRFGKSLFLDTLAETYSDNRICIKRISVIDIQSVKEFFVAGKYFSERRMWTLCAGIGRIESTCPALLYQTRCKR